MCEEKIKELLSELFNQKYNWSLERSSYESNVIAKEGQIIIEQIIRQFLLENHDKELGELKAKVYAYEKIIANSNFSSVIKENEK